MSNSSSSIWTAHLEEGEEILWQGQPYAGIRMKRKDGLRLFIGLFFMALGGLGIWGIYFYVKFNPDALNIAFWAVTLVIGALFHTGLYNAFLRLVIAALKRRKTYYAITNKRALTLKEGQFEAEPLHTDIYLEYVPGRYASLYFKKTARPETVHSTQSARSGVITIYDYKGFELLKDGEAAYQAMRAALSGSPIPAKATAQGAGRWAHVLHEGETLLWQGQPSAGWAPSRKKAAISFIGLYLLYFFGPPFLDMVVLTFSDPAGFTRLLPWLPMVIPAVLLVVGPWIYGRKKRRATYYALSNKRAFISCSFGKRQLLAHALDPNFHPVWTEGDLHSVSFGEEDAFDRRGKEKKVPLAFKDLEDGAEVYSVLSHLAEKTKRASA